jgi:DNA-directed RNA polymerase sigma subunit (sigma70/sigma32)
LASIRRLRFITRRLTHEFGREPTIRELSDPLNWSLEKTLFIERLAQLDCMSLDSPFDGEFWREQFGGGFDSHYAPK